MESVQWISISSLHSIPIRCLLFGNLCLGSRWVNHAILRTDEYRKIKVSDNKIFVDDLFRSDIDPLFVGNGFREPKNCSDTMPQSWKDSGWAPCASNKERVGRECRKDVWIEDEYCAQTCFDLGLGYEPCLRQRIKQSLRKKGKP